MADLVALLGNNLSVQELTLYADVRRLLWDNLGTLYLGKPKDVWYYIQYECIQLLDEMIELGNRPFNVMEAGRIATHLQVVEYHLTLVFVNRPF